MQSFLTAQWRYLTMLHYQIDPAVLEPLVPPGTQLDLWHDDVAWVTLVGFRFLATRVLGVAIPLHRNFSEVNLRFYVRRKADDGVRRGVVFIRELVPQPAVAWVARLAYNEPYRTVPMRHQLPADGGMAGTLSYEWNRDGEWESVRLVTSGTGHNMANGSVEEFLAHRLWGYTTQRDGSTLEYQVEHPRWLVWDAAEATLNCDPGLLFGPAVGAALAVPPALAFACNGSEVGVYRGVRVEG